MKTFPTKLDIERVLEAHQPKRTTKIKIKNDGASSLLTLCYLAFAREMAAETDKLLFMDNRLTGTKRHVLAAAKKLLPKYSYAAVIKAKVNKLQEGENLAQTSVNEEQESDTSEE